MYPYQTSYYYINLMSIVTVGVLCVHFITAMLMQPFVWQSNVYIFVDFFFYYTQHFFLNFRYH